jgi:WD40 repeat protein
VWELSSGRELRTLSGHSSSVNAVAVTADGQRAISASEDQTLKVWELSSGRELRTLSGHSSSVNAVAVTADGQRAVSVSNDKTLKVWELETGKCLATFKCRNKPLCCASFNYGKQIIVGDVRGRIYILSVEEN